MKLAATVILYHPDQSALDNIATFYNFVEKIYVFDNTVGTTVIADALKQMPKVEFYSDQHNHGIAKRLNAAASLAIHEGFEWLLTMDQDSKFIGQSFSDYIKCCSAYDAEKVAMFGTSYTSNLPISTTNCEAQKVERLITSASILNLKNYQKIGPFDEALFIDSVDYEYCGRAIMQGYCCVKFLNISLEHYIGKKVFRSSIKTLFMVRKHKEIHSPIRLYYMYRNLLYLEDKYGVESFTRHIRDYTISHIKICLLYGRDFMLIIKYLLAAQRDFRLKRMGKIEG